jgi:hypothetical protein
MMNWEIWDIIQEYAWKAWEKSRKNNSVIAGIRDCVWTEVLEGIPLNLWAFREVCFL